MVESESSKRLKSSQGSTHSSIDRISNLPAPLISQILSLLPTKCAVATSVLSTRWKFLWTCIANIDIDNYVEVGHLSEMELKAKRNRFTLFVNRVLILLNPPSIQTLSLTLGQKLSDPSYISSWISVAIGRTVRELDLFLGLAEPPFPGLAEPMELPLSHIHCNVVVLKLGGDIHFNIPAASSVCFPSLQTLHLNEIPFAIAGNSSVSFPNLKVLLLDCVIYANEDSVHKLFSSCPVLDKLTIKKNGSDNVFSLIISIPSLTSLSLTFDFQSMHYQMFKVKINTPALQYLTLEDCLACEYLPVENLSSLLQATVKFEGIHENDIESCTSIFKFMGRLSNVMFLSVSGEVLKALRIASANISPRFLNLMRLELEVYNCRDLSVVNNFLERKDTVEHLVVKGCKCYCDEHSQWTEPLNVPQCLVSRVTTISFTCTKVDCCEQLELLRYFLKNAELLQLLTVITHFSTKKKQLELQKKISMFTRGSRTCQVAFT